MKCKNPQILLSSYIPLCFLSQQFLVLLPFTSEKQEGGTRRALLNTSSPCVLPPSAPVARRKSYITEDTGYSVSEEEEAQQHDWSSQPINKSISIFSFIRRPAAEHKLVLLWDRKLTFSIVQHCKYYYCRAFVMSISV